MAKDPDPIHHENNDYKKYVELDSNPADSGYGGQSPADAGYKGQSTADSVYGGQSPADSGYKGQSPADSGYKGQSPADSGYKGQSPADSGYERESPTDSGYEGQNLADSGYEGQNLTDSGNKGQSPADSGYEGQSPADSGYEGQCSDSSQRTESQESVAGPPDGGWGWVVCFAAFCSMVILDGMMFSYGVLFLELLDYFKSGKGQTAMVGSALMGVHLLAGPMTSALVNAWGVRTVTMSGAVLATSAFACCILSPSITVLTILYGVIGGIGVSMVYIPSILTVGFYFEKRRALANGLTQSGSGIGAFLYSPFTDYLLTEYGWKGTMLILSGIVLNCLACGALYRPIKMPQRKKAEVEVEDYRKPDLSGIPIILQSSNHSSLNSITMDNSPYNNIPVIKSPTTLAHLLLSRKDKTDCFINSVPAFKTTSLSSPNSPSTQRHRLTSLRPVYCKCQPLLMNSGYLDAPRDCKCADSVYQGRRTISEKRVYHGGSKTSINDIPWNMKPLYKKDAFYSGSLLRIPEYKLGKSSSLYSFHQAPHVINAASAADEKSTSDCWKRIADVKSMIKHMLGLGLLGDHVFLLCMFSMVLWTTHSTVLTLLPDCAVIRGIGREKSAFLLSIIGIANTAARILAGWLSDRPTVNALYVNTGALFVGGLSCIAMAFTPVYSLLAAEATVFGLCMGTWTSLRPIILVEQLGLDNLTNAFGLVAMFQGGAFLVGPPIAGAIYERVNSYIITFFVAGCAFIFSGIICCILGRIHRCGPRKHTSQDLHLTEELTLEVDVKCEIDTEDI